MTFEIACLLHVFKNRDRRFCLLSRFFWLRHTEGLLDAARMQCGKHCLSRIGPVRFSASVRNIPVRLDVEGKIRVFRLHFLPDVREQAGRIRGGIVDHDIEP